MAAARSRSVRRPRSRSAGVALGMDTSKPKPQKREVGNPHLRVGQQVQPFKQTAVSGLGACQRIAAFAGDADKTLCSPSALRSRAAVAEGDEALVLHAMERGVERPGRWVPAG